jgi:hypothetical protein
MRIGRPVSKLLHLMEIQHGRRPLSWIRKYLVLNVTSKTKIFFCICMANFLKIDEADCELWYCIELPYGGRPPSWIPEMYAFCQLALNGMPSYANIKNFMPIG